MKIKYFIITFLFFSNFLFSSNKENTICFLCYDLKNNLLIQSQGGSNILKRFSPCSTFKIYNCLIGLECEKIACQNSFKKWNFYKFPISAWNQDQTLKTAMKNSVVWYFQQVAKDIGNLYMQKYLNILNYGNKNISSGITNFWLDKSLRISPKEQLDLLILLYSNNLPISQRSINITKHILVLDEKSNYTLSGKTGTGSNIGWFIGHLALAKDEFVFVALIEGKGASGRKAKKISKKYLEDLLKT